MLVKTNFFVMAALVVFVISPVAVYADSLKVSYSAKKQGRVAFENKAQDEVAASKDATAVSNPADIEPAAGDYEPEGVKEDTVARSIKLPRKNN